MHIIQYILGTTIDNTSSYDIIINLISIIDVYILIGVVIVDCMDCIGIAISRLRILLLLLCVCIFFYFCKWAYL
jgi:hypothetical protein